MLLRLIVILDLLSKSTYSYFYNDRKVVCEFFDNFHPVTATWVAVILRVAENIVCLTFFYHKFAGTIRIVLLSYLLWGALSLLWLIREPHADVGWSEINDDLGLSFSYVVVLEKAIRVDFYEPAVFKENSLLE